MKLNFFKKIGNTIFVSLLSVSFLAIAQPAANPLDIHGLDQFSNIGVRSRGMGGTTIANVNDASALFSNPAALSRLTKIEVRAGGLFGNTIRKQTQEWVPFRPVPGLSVLFEGLTGTIKMPTDTAGNPLGPWETLQRQYDNITPNWDKKSSNVLPISFVAAIPFTFGDFEVAAGIGAAQVMNLDQYYQNNNAMTPYLGQQRPDPYLITNRTDTVHVKWYQYSRAREGSVYGITPALSVSLLSGFRVGGSVTVLNGSSDDIEHRVERGHINIAIGNGVGTNFMLDTVYYNQTKTGTSTYTGNIYNVGLHYQDERYSIGITIRPEMKLTRVWNRNVVILDSTKKTFPVRVDSSRSYQESGKDYLNFPLSFSLGFVLTPTDRWTIAFDYEMSYLSDMKLTTSANSTATQPWSNNRATLRLGAEFRASDMISLRGGYRDDFQSFSPDGSAYIGEPAKGGVYSFGAGILIDNIVIDFGYEYSLLKYQDIYQSNVNYNMREQHHVLMEVAYRF